MRTSSIITRALLAGAAAMLTACGGGTSGSESFSSGTHMSRDEAPIVLEDTGRLAGGMSHSVALAANGSVYAWGDNSFGQLGIGTYLPSPAPMPVSLMDRTVIKVAAGDHHSLALASDGTVWAWGSNRYGQLGDGIQEANSSMPRPVLIDGVRSIAAGSLSSFALKRDGSLWTWGYMARVLTPNPTEVSEIEHVYGVAAGYDFALAVTEDGAVWAWGNNIFGQLGLPVSSTNTPQQLPDLDDVIQVAAGYAHSLALKRDGSVWAWGANFYGQAGADAGRTPNPVRGLPTVRSAGEIKAIAAGAYNSAVLYRDGSLWAWGANFSGQLGNNSLAPSLVPAKIEGLGKVVSVAVSNGFLIALTDDGRSYAIGYNGNGQLGNNSYVNTSVPTQVQGRSGVGYLDLGQSRGI